MKLTRNEIAALLNYYNSILFDLEDQLDNVKATCLGVIDSDLYGTQIDRYKAKIKECKNRISELEAELDSIKL